jgi:hypothetical protein
MITTRDTSAAAKAAIRPSAATMRQRILQRIVAAGIDGCTDDELQHELDIQGSTERPRRQELQQAVLITQSGEVRKTASGRSAVVWVATERGRAAR